MSGPRPGWAGAAAGLGLAGLAAGLACTVARSVSPTAAPGAPDTWGMLTAFTDYGLAAYGLGGVSLGLSLVLRRSRLRVVLTGLTVALALLHASWIWPSFVAGPRTPGTGPTVRILAANLYFGRADAAAVAEAGRQADVLVLTEMTEPARERLRRLGVEQRFPYAGGGALPTRGPAGTLVLSRFPVTGTAPLPVVVGHQNWLVTLDVPGLGAVRVAAVHPSPPLRGRSTWSTDHRLLEAALAEQPGPLIVAGDFNAVPSHWPMRRLRADGLRTAVDLAGAGWRPTWPADRGRIPPVVPIDHILLGPGLTATAAGTVRVPGTDHLAVTAAVTPVG